MRNVIKPCKLSPAQVLKKGQKTKYAIKTRIKTKANSIREPDTRKISYVRNAKKWDTTDSTVIQADTRTDFLCLNRKDDLE